MTSLLHILSTLATSVEAARLGISSGAEVVISCTEHGVTVMIEMPAGIVLDDETGQWMADVGGRLPAEVRVRWMGRGGMAVETVGRAA